jgi:hypothetical protein
MSLKTGFCTAFAASVDENQWNSRSVFLAIFFVGASLPMEKRAPHRQQQLRSI